MARSAKSYGDQSHAFLWERGHITPLGDLGGGYSVAVAINDHDANLAKGVIQVRRSWDDYAGEITPESANGSPRCGESSSNRGR